MAESSPDTFFVSVAGTRIRVRSVGQGPPLLLVMGLGGHIDMWQPLIPHLPGRRLIMFDFPGTGRSTLSWLPPTMGFNALLLSLLLRRLALGPVDVLGYSWGGLLAQHLAIQHPGTVRRLVVVASSVGLGGIPPSPAAAVGLLTPWRYYSRSYLREMAPRMFGGRHRSDEAVAEFHAALRLLKPPSPIGYLAQLSSLVGYSTLPGLASISAPTLVLSGGDDPIVSVLNPLLISRLIRHCELRVVPDAGHLLLLESPDVTGPIIDDFLAATDPVVTAA